MEKEIIERSRNNKRELYKLYSLIKKEVDFGVEMVDSKVLLILSKISNINEDLDDLIYVIQNNKNS